MTALLDANVLISLFDSAHTHHAKAHRWFAANRSKGWATCPLTENACVRILSQPAYPGRLAVADIARRLKAATTVDDHEFWPDSISLCDAAFFDHSLILTPKPLTDLYLVALAAEHQGCLVTYDRNIKLEAVRKASPANLIVLG